MNTKLTSLTFLIAGLIGSVGIVYADPAAKPQSSESAPIIGDPARELEALAQLFRADDVLGLAQAMLPPSKWEEAQLMYELSQLDSVSDDDRAEFAEKMQRFNAPDAVEQLMMEIEPELEKARPQVPGALMMAFGAMNFALTSPDSKLTDEQRFALQAALPGVQKWAIRTDFLDSNTMRHALSLLLDAGRGMGVTDLDALKAMPLETLLNRASPLLAAAKQAVRLYGVDLDAIADSLKVEVLRVDGDTARIRATVVLFDSPIFSEHELVQIEGRWYGEYAAKQWRSRHAESVDAAQKAGDEG